MRTLILAASLSLTASGAALSDEVVAFWGFVEDYNFATNPNKQDFTPDVDATASGDANLQAYLGVADELDDNGGGGFAYTSPVSGVSYGPSRSIKWDDLKGGGGDFDLGGVAEFQVDKLDGSGPATDDFGNDALIYLTLDGTGFTDFRLRFDIEGTPGDLPDSFDIFYRVGGAGATWFRDPSQNNIGLAFLDYDPVDPENQFADSGLIPLPAALNQAASIELILSDFAENGNSEMEIDNVELVATRVPEPTTVAILAAGLLAANRRCRSGHRSS